MKPELSWDAIRRVDAADQLSHERGRQFEEMLRLVYDAEVLRQADRSYSPDLILPNGAVVKLKVGQSSRRRALLRLLDVSRSSDIVHDHSPAEALLRWLGDRAERRLYRVAPPDFNDLRDDERILRSGLSHPRSGMQDPRVIEGYVAAADLGALVEDHWLDPPGVDAAPNVFLHVAPGRPDEVSPLMLAADLSEHEGPRERARAVELVAEVFA